MKKPHFFFYYDATLEQNSRTATLLNPGNPRERGTPRRKCTSLLYREGRHVGSGTILSEPEEKEQGRKGLLKDEETT